MKVFFFIYFFKCLGLIILYLVECNLTAGNIRFHIDVYLQHLCLKSVSFISSNHHLSFPVNDFHCKSDPRDERLFTSRVSLPSPSREDPETRAVSSL